MFFFRKFRGEYEVLAKLFVQGGDNVRDGNCVEAGVFDHDVVNHDVQIAVVIRRHRAIEVEIDHLGGNGQLAVCLVGKNLFGNHGHDSVVESGIKLGG